MKILYSYATQDWILVKGQTHRSMERNTEASNSPTQTCPTDIGQRCTSNSLQETLQQRAAEEVDMHQPKKQTQPKSQILFKN